MRTIGLAFSLFFLYSKEAQKKKEEEGVTWAVPKYFMVELLSMKST